MSNNGALMAGITIVNASAGSGKTYRLTEEVTAALDPGAKDRVPLEGLVAVTYTRKAHAELASRIRNKLVRAGAFEDAMRLPLAYLGTVHAACLRLLQEFALDAGLSPGVDVIVGDQGKLLRQALEAALPAENRKRLEQLSWRFELRVDSKVARVDWHTPVADIMELARGNRIAPETLVAMAERSASGLLGLLPKPEKDGASLDADLARELALAIKTLRQQDDGTKTTKNVLDALVDVQRRLEDEDMPWSDWARLSTTSPAKASQSAVAGLRSVAARYEAHPRFHDELRALTYAIFDAAERGLSAYRAWKEDRRVVDYVDLLDRALDLVDHPRVRDELASRLRLIVVDEFQDTSPIQLALFVRLHALAQRSVWVGDRKQCIFEYAGADPTLMDAVAKSVVDGGGRQDRLEDNYRSRPELVSACSELFASALAPHGFTRTEVEVDAKRSTPGELTAVPPLGLWCLESSKKEEDAQAIAEGVRRLLAAPLETQVVDRTTSQLRAVRPGDIAVLVATNAEAKSVALGLHQRGLRAAIARAGLLSTPEGVLTGAALHWLLDERDELAAATLDALLGFGNQDSEAWLTDRLQRAAENIEAPAPTADSWRAALNIVRPRLDMLAPCEALDSALSALDVPLLCARWPDAPQRVANIESLRALATEYEDRCSEEREAATITGLLRYFDEMSQETLRRDEMIASDDQHVPADEGAVIVSTYHRAKGLEWPVVVLGSLDRAERRTAFEVSPETDRITFEPQTPLEGRWIRYWPWPLGPIKKAPLQDAGEQSAEGRRVARREVQERVRLLYVGFTRARDHLVLAVRTAKGKSKSDWLDALADETGKPLLVLPIDAADNANAETTIRTAKGKGLALQTLVQRLTPEALDGREDRRVPRWFVRSAERFREPLPYRIVPSAEQSGWPEVEEAAANARITRVEKLPSAIVLDTQGYEYDALGNAVHAFLAADVGSGREEHRLGCAKRLLAGAGMTGVVRAEALLKASSQFQEWVAARWPGARWRREVPIDAFIQSAQGERRLSGIIDLLLETDEGCVIVDHKTFPGSTEAAWRARCAKFAPQFMAYAEALRRVEGKRVSSCWVHLPVGGGMVEISSTVHRS